MVDIKISNLRMATFFFFGQCPFVTFEALFLELGLSIAA